MFNKLIFTLLLLFFSGTILTAQTQQTKNKRKKDKIQQKEQSLENTKKKTPAETQKKKDPQKEINYLMRKDPRMPGYNAGMAKQLLDSIRENYVNREFPRKIQNFRHDSSKTAAGLRAVANLYKKSLSHPDLEEATGIRLSWYNEAGAAFVALYQYLDEVERGVMMGQEKRYVMSALKYMELAKKLGKILDKPEKIPSGELDKIKEKNTERRKLEIRKRINELMRQRSAEK